MVDMILCPVHLTRGSIRFQLGTEEEKECHVSLYEPLILRFKRNLPLVDLSCQTS